jgi:hypothetical protein
MKTKAFKTLVIALTILSVIVNYSCSNSKTEDTARVQLKLVDAPGDYLEVNIEIIDIQYNAGEEEGWMSFTPVNGYPINIDLTELIAGNSLLLTDELIPAGMLKQVRLVLSENNTLRIEGEEDLIPLNTPSAQQSGLKLLLNEELEGGFSYTFILDWVVSESIVMAGNSGNYNLKPVIKVTAEVNSGSINGQVKKVNEANLELEAMPNIVVQVFDTSNEFVTDSQTNDLGEFLIQGLDAGDYILKIEQEGYEMYTSVSINVTVGTVESAGIIVLEAIE